MIFTSYKRNEIKTANIKIIPLLTKLLFFLFFLNIIKKEINIKDFTTVFISRIILKLTKKIYIFFGNLNNFFLNYVYGKNNKLFVKKINL